jgi:uncharacterized repeat protein (TIGR01451 family)
VNSGAAAITCGGWVCRNSSGAGTTSLVQNAFMEGGIDLAAAGFSGCFNTFLPHTRSSQSFTAVLKDFAGPIAFSNCKTPTITTQQSASGVTPGANITVGVPASVTDTATLHGTASTVGGTVSYKLYSDANCTTQVGDGGTKNVSGSPDANGDLVLPASNAVQVNNTGTYYWQASYSGDIATHGSNQAATSACGDEILTVVAPNLSITKTADASPVSAGDNIGFTITATNNGLGTANNVTINDPLPAGSGVNWSISPAYAGPGTCAITGAVGSQTLGCTVGSLANGASASVHISSPTVRASCGTYNNSATVAASNNGAVPPAQASIIVQCPNLSITKTADAASVSAGSNIGFTITVSNAGPGTAKSVSLSDALPTGAGIAWSISPPAAGCAINSGTLTCNFGDMGANTSKSVHVTSATVFASCATYPNTATAEATNNPTVTANASTTVNCPGLQISKTADNATVSAGDQIGFTITVSNTGVGTATGVTLSDPLPGGTGVNWSINPATAGCSITGSAPNQSLSCSFGDLASQATRTVHVVSGTTSASCKAYPNTATASATNQSSVQASDTTTVNCPNLAIDKTADHATVNAGDPIGFSITVTNNGVGTAKSVTLNDPLPTGAGISWSISPAYPGPGTCNIASNTLSCSFGDMANGASATVHVVSNTTVATPCQAYLNTATAQATNNSQVQDSASTTVQCPALQITKTADAPSVNAGDPIGFTISVKNTGAGTAQGGTLVDPLPTGTGINWVESPDSAACSITAGVLSCTFGDMATNATASVHVMSNTTFDSCKSYPNTATASATNIATPVTAQASTTVNCPDLHITKTADAATVNAGEQIGFTITVSNTSVGTATGVTLNDPLPTGTGISWSKASGPQGCSIANNTLSCTAVDLAQGASYSVHITSPTTFASCKTYSNTATASATNHASVNATDTTTVRCPDLSITKTADDTTVSAGEQIGFTITVMNSAVNGTGTAKAVTLTDPLPTGTGISWSESPDSAACNIAANVLSCSFGDLAPGASVSVHVVSGTTADSCKLYTNTATASATNHPSINATASTTVQCANLSITKVADATPVNTGDPIGFSITVSNDGAPGTGTALGVTMSDPLPAGNGVSWSISPAYAGQGTCSISGNPPSQTLNCTIGDLAPGASTSIHISSATTAASAGTYPNTATASASNTGSVQATATIVVQPPALSITKSADHNTVSAGEDIGFTITASNVGPGIARNATINDPLPAANGVSWSISPAYAGQGTCSVTGAVGSQTLSCALGDLLAQSSVSVHVTSATTFASCGTLHNTATVAATNGTSAEASADTTVACPDLSLTKTADDQTVSAGDAIGFKITVSNSDANGTGTAKGVALDDPLPSGTGIDWSIASGPQGCSITNNTLSCPAVDLAAGDSYTVHITSPTAFASCANYENTATLNADNHPQLQATADTTVECPDLSITKTADASPVNTGDSIGFTVEVSNAGPGTAKAVHIDDPLPSGSGVDWSISPAYSGPGTCSITGSAPNQTLSCSLGNLAAEASASVHIASATDATSAGTYPNTATASASNHDSVEASAEIVVIPPALSITKTADDDTVNAGQDIGFTVTVANEAGEGVGIARAVTLSDPLPAGDGVNWSIDPAYAGPGTCSISGSAPSQVLECAFGDMAPGDGASVHVSSATTDASVGTYDNTATAAATNAPPVEASATTKVIAVATVTTVGSTVAPTTTVAETPAQLPFTGGNSQGLLLAGTALVLAGGALALSRRRRQAGQH